MAKRERVLKPGEAQVRRAAFCLKALGLLVVFTFVTAIIVGLPFPAVWTGFFTPVIATSFFVLIGLEFVFLLRAAWFKFRARHYAALIKMNIGD